jgi:hypothetical protein
LKFPILKTVVVALVGSTTLCGCASTSDTNTTAPKTSIGAPAPLPKNPKLEAYVDAMRADLSDGKVKTINGVMKLSSEEATVFWPIYEEYESELFELGDKRIDLIRRFALAQEAGIIHSTDATMLSDGYFKFEQHQLDLKKKYFGIIASELSPIRAAQFIQIEHRVGTMIDLAIASEMPLIKASPAVETTQTR